MTHIFATLLASLLVFPLAAFSDDHIFVSEEQKFSVQYPKKWNRAETILPQTIIRLESPDGEDFNIGVTDIPQLKDVPVKDYTKTMLGLVETMIDKSLSKQ